MARDPEQMEDRLEELKERTDEVRRQAEEHGTLPDSTPEQSFIDPDGDGRIDDDDEDPGSTSGF
ncbi:MAG: hypothetical protein ABWZ76_11165 [Acidimicrobiales bacterium]